MLECSTGKGAGLVFRNVLNADSRLPSRWVVFRQTDNLTRSITFVISCAAEMLARYNCIVALTLINLFTLRVNKEQTIESNCKAHRFFIEYRAGAKFISELNRQFAC